jgi:aminopeptidase N
MHVDFRVAAAAAAAQDPFPKPCYLFALVAGDLVVKEDSFTTSSGRRVVLRIYTQPANISQVRACCVLH